MRQLLQARRPHTYLAVWLMLTLTGTATTTHGEDVDPRPAPKITGPLLHRWSFERDTAGWTALHQCELKVSDGAMIIRSTGDDPYLAARLNAPVPGPVTVRLKIRSTTIDNGKFFWASDRQPQIGEKQSVEFRFAGDGQWHECEVPLEVQGSLTLLRLDPGAAPGRVDVQWIELRQTLVYPVEIERVVTTPNQLAVHLKNTSQRPVTVSVAGRQLSIEPGKKAVAVHPLSGTAAFEVVEAAVAIVSPEAKNQPPLTRRVVVVRPEGKAEWTGFHSVDLGVHVAGDGSGALLLRGGKPVGAIAPLVWDGSKLPRLHITSLTKPAIELSGEGIDLRLTLCKDQVFVHIRSDRPVEGPVVRPLGKLHTGLFAGLEYLGKGERSSSKLDIETADHLRFAPDRLKVTMPLMAVVTDRASVALAWNDMTLQPTFAAPNFVDGAWGEHRMSLRGRRIDAVVRIADGPLEDAILWAVERKGLPPLPPAPYDEKTFFALAARAFEKSVAGPGGWGHCVEPKWKRQPFADIASAIWRISGKVPAMDRLVPGGGHVRNDAIYFVTGRGQQWLDMRRQQVQGIIASQRPDGSFRYRGQYQRGHDEDTSSGYCAQQAMQLLDFASLTGDRAAREAGIKTLEYMKRFDVPRGAQTWELSLHTPDILASAHLVRAYTLGYELTGRAEYLAAARRWALTGIPFVYLWDCHPTMRYGTIAVYGATNYRAPLWIGLPVQWCGGVYAYALTKLAPHDKTLDWNHLARGIHIAGQQMLSPDGPTAGCLPDSWVLASQRRAGPFINPSAWVCLHLALEGRVDSLAVAAEGKHRVAAPFPVIISGKTSKVQGTKGLAYQAIVDGRVVDIQSKGEDLVELGE